MLFGLHHFLREISALLAAKCSTVFTIHFQLSVYVVYRRTGRVHFLEAFSNL